MMQAFSRPKMRTQRFSSSWISKMVGAIALGGTLFVANSALAGDLKYGEGVDAFEVGEDGKLTGDSEKNSLKKLDKIPGEDAWDLSLWASLDSGRAEGPLYIEFWQRVSGQDAIVHRHEIPDYDGSRYVLENILLEGNIGFNKDRTYTVKVLQVNSRGKDVVLAKGSLELINTGRQPEEEPEEEGDDEGEEEVDSAAQDALDSLAGPDEVMKDQSAESEAPPPAEPSKKGCAVDPEAGFSGLAILMLAGLAFGRRRED